MLDTFMHRSVVGYIYQYSSSPDGLVMISISSREIRARVLDERCPVFCLHSSYPADLFFYPLSINTLALLESETR